MSSGRAWNTQTVVPHLQLGHDERTTDIRLRQVEVDLIRRAAQEADAQYGAVLDEQRAHCERITNPDRSVTIRIAIPEKEGLW